MVNSIVGTASIALAIEGGEFYTVPFGARAMLFGGGPFTVYAGPLTEVIGPGLIGLFQSVFLVPERSEERGIAFG